MYIYRHIVDSILLQLMCGVQLTCSLVEHTKLATCFGGVLTLTRDRFQASIRSENQESLHFLHAYISKIMSNPNMPLKNMQCWKSSRNAGCKHLMIKCEICWPIRAEESGSYGSKGPLTGATDLEQRPHHPRMWLGPTGGSSGPWAVGRSARLAEQPKAQPPYSLWCGNLPLVHEVGSKWISCSSSPYTPMAPSYK